MQDVADRVGVSKALVSLVFRNQPGPSSATREKVIEAAHELGYRVNRAAALMTAKRSHLLGVSALISNSFHAEVVEHLVEVADDAGYEVVLGAVTSRNVEARVVDTLLDFRCEGMLLLGPQLSNSALTTLGAQVPTVSIGRRVPGGVVDVVRANDSKGIAQVVDHLSSLGHSQIAHVSGGRGVIAGDRRNGYLRAMRRHGLEAQSRVVDGDFTAESGAAAATAMLADGLPTAVTCVNDPVAVGVIDTLRRAGVEVPGDVSVAGYDDSPLARLGHLDLTTVSQSPVEQARVAIGALVSRLDDGRTDVETVVLEPELVVRSTTAPLD
ncbi:LacI family DNA-binding transcriptional regulator [Gordonia soli]|uniref:Putative LacI family transcriptional regulator n=1 Tax=Gordonia soli NBRC 108243 TaxID=1223545 RepID=M0QEG4_9ACTN|nr:LacI family DNA-binding transcriptional regulator [Gordonia soli]GAC66829.1 putative LacI family transcriptional regulator [Gordonia soli NBRC 108243]